MERLHRRAEALGIAADLVERYQAVEYIECGVLDAFGGDRCGELLKAHCEGAVRWRERRRRTFRGPKQKDIADEIEDAGVGV